MMKTAKELVDQINAAKLKTPHGVSDEIDMDGVKELETIDLESHRWYNMGTVVFSVGDEFFGVHGPVEVEDHMRFSDIEYTCEAFEMEQIQSVTYKQKDMKKSLEQDIKDCSYCRNFQTGAEIRGVHICANHMVIWAVTGAKDIGEEKDYGDCELCAQKAIGIALDFETNEGRGDVEWRLCKDHIMRVGRLNLTPEDVKKMWAKHGVTFLTHDDYYDGDGTACQPR
jgi:hypothetical protein